MFKFAFLYFIMKIFKYSFMKKFIFLNIKIANKTVERGFLISKTKSKSF